MKAENDEGPHSAGLRHVVAGSNCGYVPAHLFVQALLFERLLVLPARAQMCAERVSMAGSLAVRQDMCR
ncbi:MAG: hypothetical protein ABI748_04090 [Dokdonella sp.]